MVAFSGFYESHHQAMHTVLYRRIAMAIQTASKVGTCSIIFVLIVALAAAGEIRSEYLSPDGGIRWLPVKPNQRTAMTIKIACTGGAFVRHCRLY